MESLTVHWYNNTTVKYYELINLYELLFVERKIKLKQYIFGGEGAQLI